VGRRGKFWLDQRKWKGGSRKKNLFSFSGGEARTWLVRTEVDKSRTHEGPVARYRKGGTGQVLKKEEKGSEIRAQENPEGSTN